MSCYMCERLETTCERLKTTCERLETTCMKQDTCHMTCHMTCNMILNNHRRKVGQQMAVHRAMARMRTSKGGWLTRGGWNGCLTRYSLGPAVTCMQSLVSPPSISSLYFLVVSLRLLACTPLLALPCLHSVGCLACLGCSACCLACPPVLYVLLCFHPLPSPPLLPSTSLCVL